MNIHITNIASNKVEYTKDGKEFFMHINRGMLQDVAGYTERIFEEVRLPQIKQVLDKYHQINGKRA